ncbi:MAG: hypothetical protein RL417_2278 [Pseudomonadota bacterium]|jgi:hypothetical protein
MSPTAKFFNGIFFLAAALSIVAIGAQELHRRHSAKLETTAESRRLLAELQPAVKVEVRASHRWEGKVAERTRRSDAEEAERIAAGLEGEDTSEFSKFMQRVSPW